MQRRKVTQYSEWHSQANKQRTEGKIKRHMNETNFSQEMMTN